MANIVDKLHALNNAFSTTKSANESSLLDSRSRVLNFSFSPFPSTSKNTSALNNPVDENLVQAVLMRLKTEEANIKLPSDFILEDLIRFRLKDAILHDENNPLSRLIDQAVAKEVKGFTSLEKKKFN